MTTRRLFVAGATGAVGQALLPLADARKLEVVAHVRPKSAGRLAGRQVVALELSDPKLGGALRGCTTVIQLIGTMRKRFASGDTYETSDIGTTRQLVDAAKVCGTVDHFVLLSSVGAGSPTGAYLKAKAEAERLVVAGGLPYTIFRPSAFEDREGAFFPGMRAVTSLLGLKKYQPIKLAELAGAILHVAAERAPLGVALEGQSLWDQVGR
ncbi:MAG: SDR family oxidoreductase [Myxococcota bacterium]